MMHRAVCLKLLTLARGIQIKAVAEVGVWLGESAYFLAQFFPEAHLYLVDPWKPSSEYLEKGHAPSFLQKDYNRAHENVKRLLQDNPQVSILKKTSQEALSLVPNNLDLVFIDGDHSYQAVKQDILSWKKKVRPGGILAGHDYSPEFPGVVQAVDECLKDQLQLGEETIWFIQVPL